MDSIEKGKGFLFDKNRKLPRPVGKIRSPRVRWFSMEKIVIVGGGIAGLSVAQILKRKNLPFIGLEKNPKLGGKIESGCYRFSSNETINFFSRLLGKNIWTEFSKPAKERHKGEWANISAESDIENIFLTSPYRIPEGGYKGFLHQLENGVAEKFQLQKEVEQVFPDDKKVICTDGTEFAYTMLVWCTDPLNLIHLCQTQKDILSKNLRGIGEGLGAVVVENTFEMALIEDVYPFVFTFRFKDKKLRVIGLPDNDAEQNTGKILRWLLLLDKSLLEDREETAKCFRAFKREVQKEFPHFKEWLQNERIIFFPKLTSETPAKLKSLEILANLFYVGCEAVVTEEPKNPALPSFDHLAKNCTQFESFITH